MEETGVGARLTLFSVFPYIHSYLNSGNRPNFDRFSGFRRFRGKLGDPISAGFGRIRARFRRFPPKFSADFDEIFATFRRKVANFVKSPEIYELFFSDLFWGVFGVVLRGGKLVGHTIQWDSSGFERLFQNDPFFLSKAEKNR